MEGMEQGASNVTRPGSRQTAQPVLSWDDGGGGQPMVQLCDVKGGGMIPRWQQVADLADEGMTAKEAAERLGICEDAVRVAAWTARDRHGRKVKWKRREKVE